MTASFSEGWRLVIAVCGLAHRGPTCGFLLLCIKVASESSTLFNPFMPSELFYLNSLDRPISYVRCVWLVLLPCFVEFF